MVAIERSTAENVAKFKAVRLRALQDTPHAFSATYAQESRLTDEEWLQRTQRWNGERGIGFLAMEDGGGSGIAGSFLDEKDATRAQLISMWTAATHRRRGVGRMLVDAVLDWAKLRKAGALHLLVTSNNEPAVRFYERLGFARTGRTEPYPNDPAVTEYEMARAII